MIGLVVLLLVLLLAYLDGGEGAVQPMEQAVTVPQLSGDERSRAIRSAAAIFVLGPF